MFKEQESKEQSIKKRSMQYFELNSVLFLSIKQDFIVTETGLIMNWKLRTSQLSFYLFELFIIINSRAFFFLIELFF